jgi:hypothetical protein
MNKITKRRDVQDNPSCEGDTILLHSSTCTTTHPSPLGSQ